MIDTYELKQTDQLDLFQSNLPHKPYYANDLDYGVRIASKAVAIKHKHIQPNPPHARYWLVYDVDRKGAGFDWRFLDVPPPNIIATNPENGHAHLFYSINVPIRIAHDGSCKALRFAGAIDQALCKALEADRLYSGLIAKNPLHDHWQVETHQEWCYDLAWLADYFDLSEYNNPKKRLPSYGLGRNSNTFDYVREIAYTERRSHDGSYEAFYDTVFKACMSYNQSHNSTPLSIQELKHIAKSIAKWVWRNMSPAGFIAWCQRKGSYGGKKSKRGKSSTSERTTKPWEDMGISRRTYYNDKKRGLL